MAPIAVSYTHHKVPRCPKYLTLLLGENFVDFSLFFNGEWPVIGHSVAANMGIMNDGIQEANFFS